MKALRNRIDNIDFLPTVHVGTERKADMLNEYWIFEGDHQNFYISSTEAHQNENKPKWEVYNLTNLPEMKENFQDEFLFLKIQEFSNFFSSEKMKK
jgi:hypothetical protein